MTSRVIREAGTLVKIVIRCDRMSCDIQTDDAIIAAGGGLRNMGWTTAPRDGRMFHYCPEHRP